MEDQWISKLCCYQVDSCSLSALNDGEGELADIPFDPAMVADESVLFGAYDDDDFWLSPLPQVPPPKPDVASVINQSMLDCTPILGMSFSTPSGASIAMPASVPQDVRKPSVASIGSSGGAMNANSEHHDSSTIQEDIPYPTPMPSIYPGINATGEVRHPVQLSRSPNHSCPHEVNIYTEDVVAWFAYQNIDPSDGTSQVSAETNDSRQIKPRESSQAQMTIHSPIPQRNTTVSVNSVPSITAIRANNNRPLDGTHDDGVQSLSAFRN